MDQKDQRIREDRRSYRIDEYGICNIEEDI